jgi:hypothetical protein
MTSTFSHRSRRLNFEWDNVADGCRLLPSSGRLPRPWRGDPARSKTNERKYRQRRRFCLSWGRISPPSSCSTQTCSWPRRRRRNLEQVNPGGCISVNSTLLGLNGLSASSLQETRQKSHPSRRRHGLRASSNWRKPINPTLPLTSSEWHDKVRRLPHDP